MTSRSMRKWSISVCVVIAALIMLTPLRTMTTRLPRSVPVVKRLPLIVQVRAPRVSRDEDGRLLAERRDDADARRALAEAGARRGGGEALAEQQRQEREQRAGREVIDPPMACACKRSSCRQRGERGRRGLLQRPVDVLANERARRLAARLQRGDDRRDRRSPRARCRARRRDCAASARSRCGGSRCPRSRAGSRPRARPRGRAARGASSAGRTSKSAIGLALANLFHGQTSWQSSQP